MAGMLFAVFAYLCFNLVSGALALFLSGLPELFGIPLPITVDASIWPPLSPWLAGTIDLGLIVVFGLQHSVMARPGFKRWFTGFVPPHLERYLALPMGLAGGILGGATGISGPAIVSYLFALQLEKREMVYFLCLLYVVAAIVQVASFVQLGLYDATTLAVVPPLTPDRRHAIELATWVPVV